MGLFGAMLTAVSGISSQAFSLENISGNIANSRTIGYKRIDTTFADIVREAPVGQERAGSVRANSVGTTKIQGDITSTGISTNVGISGEGFLVVRKATSDSQRDYYTRKGDFSLDKNGFLVNTSGYAMTGFTIDPLTGARAVGGIAPITVARLSAQKTERVDWRGNLPSIPITSNYVAGTADSELLDPTAFSVDPRASGAGYVQADEVEEFKKQTIDGGDLKIYDEKGTQKSFVFRWGKLAHLPSDTWNLFYREDSSATGTAPTWRNAGQDLTFSQEGLLSSSSLISLASVNLDSVNFGAIKLDFGDSKKMTQYADLDGRVTIDSFEQDGYDAAVPVGVSIDNTGVVYGEYTNGQTLNIAELAISTFRGERYLQKLSGEVFDETLDSGPPTLAERGQVSIFGGAVEASNTDISEEFSKMIVTQQAYAANTRILSTSQQMLQEVISIVR